MVWAETRNDIPETPGYVYRGRAYPWAQATIRAAEQAHGEPVPTCLCGACLDYGKARVRRCESCGRAPADLEASR